MGLTSSSGAAAGILGLGHHLPGPAVANAEICERIDSTDEWIRKRSGIRSRHLATDDSVVDLAVRAGRNCLQACRLTPAEIDTVIVATITHPYQTPAAAPLVATGLGCRAAAFDISAACAGFCHAVAVADGLVRAGSARHVLVIGAERMSDFVDWQDRSTAFLFGDGAGAAVIGPSPDGAAGIGPVVWGSEGSRADLVDIGPTWIDCRDGSGGFRPDAAWPVLRMAGLEVFTWACQEMAEVARQAVRRAGLDLGDLRAFVPHQANRRIVTALARALDLPEEVVVADSVVTDANTSAASIPLALSRLIEDGRVGPGDPALLLGFGAGLSFAAQVVRIPAGI